MNKDRVTTAPPAADTARPDTGASPTSQRRDGISGWTGGRVAAAVIGALLVLCSLGLLGAGGTALWMDRTQRDAAGYVTTGAHSFSTSGSALVTEPADLASPGVGWLYSSVLLGEVRIRVTPVGSGTPVFAGIGDSSDVDRYLAGVSHTVISDFWTNQMEPIDGSATPAAPASQNFWAASVTGSGEQTVTWEPTNGSWSVVVMNADGRPGVDVQADLGATYPTLLGVAIFLLVIGAIAAIGGVLLIVGAIRRANRARSA